MSREAQCQRGTVIVTGASSGIGLATAVILAESGFRVVATVRGPGRRAALDEAAADRGLRFQVLQLEITDPGSVEHAIETVVRQSGPIYGLVNNAGMMVRGFFEDLADDEIRRAFETNVFGTMAVTRAALPHMRKRRQGRVVIVSSVSGRLGSLGVSAYCTTKFALEGLAESLSQEMSPFGVFVSLIEPGFVATRIFDRDRGVARRAADPAGPHHEAFRRFEGVLQQQMLRSTTSPEEVAHAIHRALTARRPRLRYAVGRRARIVLALRRYLPERVFEGLWARGLDRRLRRQRLRGR